MAMVCLDWFVAASSSEDGSKAERTTDVLLLTDVETGYMAAIPAKSKACDSYPHLVEMVVNFLRLMRHESGKLRADGEPTIKGLVKGSVSSGLRSTNVWWKKLLSTALPATGELRGQSRQ